MSSVSLHNIERWGKGWFILHSSSDLPEGEASANVPRFTHTGEEIRMRRTPVRHTATLASSSIMIMRAGMRTWQDGSRFHMSK
jgi:hypothetical protein